MTGRNGPESPGDTGEIIARMFQEGVFLYNRQDKTITYVSQSNPKGRRVTREDAKTIHEHILKLIAALEKAFPELRQ